MAIFTLRDVFDTKDIPFRECGEYRSPKEAFNSERSKLTMQYYVNWADKVDATAALLGATTGWNSMRWDAGTRPPWAVGANVADVSPPLGVAWLTRYLPHQHPTYNWMYATDLLLIEGMGTPLGIDGAGMQLYSDARITIDYTRPLYGVLSDTQVRNPAFGGVQDEGQLTRFVIRRAPIGREKAFTYQVGSWTYLDTGRPCPGAVGSFYTLTTLEYIWLGVPVEVVPRSFYALASGCVNANTFDSYPPETLLFRAPSLSPVVLLPSGGLGYNVTVRLDHNPKNWNFVPDRNNNNQWRRIGRQSGGITIANARPYQTIDFPWLFRPSASG